MNSEERKQVHHYKTNTNNSIDLCRNYLDYSVWYILHDVISINLSQKHLKEILRKMCQANKLVN